MGNGRQSNEWDAHIHDTHNTQHATHATHVTPTTPRHSNRWSLGGVLGLLTRLMLGSEAGKGEAVAAGVLSVCGQVRCSTNERCLLIDGRLPIEAMSRGVGVGCVQVCVPLCPSRL